MLLATSDERRLIDTVRRDFAELERAGFDERATMDLQRRKLAALLDRARGVAAYRHVDEFASLPVLSKETVRARSDDFVAAGVTFARYYETSGSTGAYTPSPRTAEDIVLNAAAVAELWRRVLPDGSRIACLLPSDVVPVADLVVGVADLLECVTLRAYPFSQGITDWDRLEALVESFAPDTLFAAPGVILQWTRVLKRRGRLGDMSKLVSRLMLLGEVSTPALRRKIGRDWAAGVYDASYGSTETGTVAASCEHDRLHCLSHAHLLELRTGELVRPLTAGGTGELVVTPLHAHARPLLRFAIGDVVAVAPDRCACGLGLPVIQVRGRQSDQVYVKGVPLAVDALESVVYGDPNVTGYLVQLKEPDGRAARLLLERDVAAGDPDEAVVAGIRARSIEAGLDWDAVAVVDELPVLTKAGGSRKNWKRTNLQWVS